MHDGLQIALGNISETSCAPGIAHITNQDPNAEPEDLATKTSKPPPDSCVWDSKKSRRITWDEVAAADPDVLVVACCGFDFLRNCGDGQASLSTNPKARALRAVQNGRVFAVDGNRCVCSSYKPLQGLVHHDTSVFLLCIRYGVNPTRF